MNRVSFRSASHCEAAVIGLRSSALAWFALAGSGMGVGGCSSGDEVARDNAIQDSAAQDSASESPSAAPSGPPESSSLAGPNDAPMPRPSETTPTDPTATLATSSGGTGGEAAREPVGPGALGGNPSAGATAGSGGAEASAGTAGAGAEGGGEAQGDEGNTTATGGSAGESTAGAASGGSSGAPGGAGTGGTPASGCENGKVVHFVYFVEGDQEYSESQYADVERHAFAFQQYWYEQLGVTFYLNEPVVDVIEADHDSSWYVETPDGIHSDERWYRLGNIKTEVYDKLGIRDFDDDHRVVNYPITRHDGRVGGNFGGAWMDGDDMTCIADNGPTYPYDDGNPAHCLGHPAHEFGHLLGLDHEGPNDDCMQYGFYLGGGAPQMCQFSEANVQSILSDPNNDGWFEAMPGDTCTGT
jgi:hypothetical protein